MKTQSACVVDDNESLTSEPVEININEPEWFQEELYQSLVAYSEDEPTLKEALRGDEKHKWWNAIEAELKQIENLHTYDLVEAPSNANIIPSIYVFCRKRNEEGLIIRYKARLVAKGYKQKFGVDYNETFTPTVCPATLRIILSLGAQKNASIHQIDVKNVYLNSYLDKNKELYMELPPLYHEFRDLPPNLQNSRKIICKLCRPLYRTKQGAQNWYMEVVQVLTELGFTMSNADEALFFKIQGERYTLVGVATDDFTIVTDSDETVNKFKSQLTIYWKISDLGPINWLLGVAISHDLINHTISLSQESYIEQILV